MPDKVIDFGLTRLSTEGIFAVLFICFLIAFLAGIIYVVAWATGLITSSFRELITTLTGINANLSALSAKGQELDALSKIVYQTSDSVARLEKLSEKMYEMLSAIGIRSKQ
jgi:hypothetical protein